MENPTDQAEAPAEALVAINGPNLNRTFTVRRKAAKLTLPWDLTAEEIKLAASLSIPTRKKRRIEEPPLTTTDEADRKNPSAAASPELSVGICPPAVDNNEDDDDDDESNEDHVANTQPNARATGRWTLEEDAKLTSAVTKTFKKNHVKEPKIYWVLVAALVPGQTNKQCRCIWKKTQEPNTDRANRRIGKWTKSEFVKLEDAVHTHGGKNWSAVATLLPGRTKQQCWGRWKTTQESNTDRANRRAPGRTKQQCWYRWKKYMERNRSAVRGKEHGARNEAPTLGQDPRSP